MTRLVRICYLILTERASCVGVQILCVVPAGTWDSGLKYVTKHDAPIPTRLHSVEHLLDMRYGRATR